MILNLLYSFLLSFFLYNIYLYLLYLSLHHFPLSFKGLGGDGYPTKWRYLVDVSVNNVVPWPMEAKLYNLFKNLSPQYRDKYFGEGKGHWGLYIPSIRKATGEANRVSKGKKSHDTQFITLRNVSICVSESTLKTMRESKLAGKPAKFVAIGFQGTASATVPTEESARKGIRISINPFSDTGFVYADSRYPHLDRKPAPKWFREVQAVPSGTYAMRTK